MISKDAELYYVKDWWTHQHYKFRNPPWIKLHRSIMSDPVVQSLTPGDRYRLICLWLIASDQAGTFSANLAKISANLASDHKHRASKLLAQFEAKGLISKQDIRGQIANLAPTRRQDGPTELQSNRAPSLFSLENARKEKGAQPKMPASRAAAARAAKAEKLEEEKAQNLLMGICKTYAFESWKARFGKPPAWAEKDFVGLARMLKRNHEITESRFKAHWDRYLGDDDEFTRKQGHSLAFFCSRFDAYMDPELLRPKIALAKPYY
jgi:hypothetical protein